MSRQLLAHAQQGSEWTVLPRAMLHEYKQNNVNRSVLQSSFIDNLELQMAEQETAFGDSLATLLQAFIFRDPEVVKRFLTSHRDVVPVLIESLQHLTPCFGSDATLALEVMTDEGAPDVIYALALWQADRLSARKLLREFDDRWWLKNARRTAGRVVFDYELL